jgi:hypothetical protein
MLVRETGFLVRVKLVCLLSSSEALSMMEFEVRLSLSGERENIESAYVGEL